ncbi:MAG: phosphoribosylanthranilate isomerase [Chloroflexota bacterium]|nr:phosphoribosylanthranilate isomerase [Chloroflexota bacterium]
MKVKVCGITNVDDALAAIELGAEALGFVFAPSPRQVAIQDALRIVKELPPFVSKVGIFVDEDLDIIRDSISLCGLDLVQLHGSESSELCRELSPRVIKAFRVKDDSVLNSLTNYKVVAYLLDAYSPERQGGTGQVFDWGIAKKAVPYGRIILSGGLTPENVQLAIKTVGPYAVDVSSGVESEPGKKDHVKLRAFLEAARNA